jgi:Ca2+-binding RTX toxin-like protein
MKHHTLYGTIAALTLFDLAAVAAPSRAANLDLTAGGQLIYEATQSIMVANDLTIALSGSTYAIQDPAEPGIGISANAQAAGCDYFNNQMITCPAAPIVSLAVDTKEGSDTIDLSGVIVSAIVIGGGGPDTIIGGTKDDSIVWNTFDGSDVVDGGPGADTLVFQSGNSDGTTDGYDNDVVTILQNGGGFALYRDRGNVSMDVRNTEQLLLNTFTGNDTVATTGLVGTTQLIQTVFDGLPDTLTFDAAGFCPFAAPGWIEIPGREEVQYTNFANVSVTNTTCVPTTCNGMAATNGCTVNGVRNQPCIGTAGDDVIQGTAGADVIVGGSGRDRIYTGAGNDLACGDDGNDLIEGERGNDYMLGGKGADRIDGGAGGDDLIGGEGDDDLRGDAGIDDLTGGPGNDRLRGGGDRDVLQGSEGADVLDGGSAVDTCTDVDQAGPFINCELL